MFIETEVSFYGAPMFYFKEVYTRLLYCVLSTSLLFFVCYNSSELICSLYFIGLLRFIRALGENVTSPHFVYTSPLELWNLLYNLFIFLALTLSFPFYVWNALMFYKSSLFSWEYRRVRRAIVLLVVLIILLNLLCFFIILPGTCSVLAEFNNELVFSSVLDIFLELKVTDFFGYLCDFFLFFNFFCFLVG
jgi:Sec-independent protein secretion pathway component TatC